MKRFVHLFSLCFLLITTSLQAGVTYKVIYNFALSRYEVYMNSSIAYSGPLARISSAQVTILVPHNTGFTPINLTGGNGNGLSPAVMNWGVSRYDGPTENTTKDYLFFGYNASSNPSVLFNIPANTDVLLFHFQNSGTCNGTIALIENATSVTPDPFLPPNSQSLNTPNAMTIFGAGNINIYVANAGGIADCASEPCTAKAGVINH